MECVSASDTGLECRAGAGRGGGQSDRSGNDNRKWRRSGNSSASADTERDVRISICFAGCRERQGGEEQVAVVPVNAGLISPGTRRASQSQVSPTEGRHAASPVIIRRNM